MRPVVLAVSATALVMVGGVAGACAPASSEEPVVSSGSRQVQRLADETFRSFGGSKYQRDAGAVLANFAESGPAVECMRERGLTEADWSMPRPVNPESRGLETSDLFNAPGVLPYAEMLMSTAPASWPGKEDSALTAEQEATADECWASAPQAAGSSSPAAAKKLREKWWAMLHDFDESLGSEISYWRCLSEADIDGTTGLDSDTAVLRALESRTPAARDIPDSPTSEAAASAEWRDLEAFERALRDAEFACRADVYNGGIEEVGECIEQFRDDNAELIAQAQDGWGGIVARAEKLGYTGAYESLAGQ